MNTEKQRDDFRRSDRLVDLKKERKREERGQKAQEVKNREENDRKKAMKLKSEADKERDKRANSRW